MAEEQTKTEEQTKKKKKRAGRKPMLTKELSDKICAFIASGLTKKGAASAVCMSERTFYDCISRGEADIEKNKDTIYSQFVQSVKAAEAQFKLTHIKNIKNAAQDGSWQASAWMLERCYRDEYGKAAMDVNLGGQKDAEPIKTENAVQIYLPDNHR